MGQEMTQQPAPECTSHYCQKDSSGHWVCLGCGMRRDRYGKTLPSLTLIQGRER